MKILITGVAGFIGFHVAQRLLKQGVEIVGIDSINDYYDTGLKFSRLNELGVDHAADIWYKSVVSKKYPALVFIRMKLEDTDAIINLFAENKFDRVINLAAQAGVRYSIDHPRDYIDSNIIGFFNILEGCRHTNVPHLVYASSSSVYGLNTNRPLSTHDNVDHPVSLYAATKKSNELMAHAYSHLYKLPTTGLRFFTVYGPWGRPDMAYFKFSISILEEKTIDIYNNGDMYRDFTYIDDIVDGILHVAYAIQEPDPSWDPGYPDPSISSAPYKIYNIGNNKPVKLAVFIETLEKAIGKVAKKNYLPMQMGDVYATEAEVEDLEKTFLWKPKYEIGEGLSKFISWMSSYYSGESDYSE